MRVCFFFGVGGPGVSDLDAAAVHLDDLRPQGLDGGQDELLVLQGRHAQAQHVSTETRNVQLGGGVALLERRVF